ncbi:MAG: sugar phosphate isomerase/epimerase [Clostridiales bacterium]|jgi:sugar phosphate isomerase/epimerase|nr:sugar phosphate isomerase/epimerase [Clostridiales bacterium]
MGKYRYGVELYSVKGELAKDMPGTLRAMKGMGYEGVEFFGEFKHTAAEVKEALDAANLACCGWHTPWSYVQDDKLESTADYFAAIGNQYVIVPGMPDELTATPEKAKQTAALYNAIAAKLSKRGMSIGYHNHASELHFYAGSTACPFTALFDNTDPSVVVQMDNGHVVNGRGFGLLSLLRRYPGRYKTVHLKPYSLDKGAVDAENGYNTMIGEDDVPWLDFMRICSASGGTQWFIVEYESAAMYPELDGVDQCIKALKKMESKGEI